VLAPPPRGYNTTWSIKLQSEGKGKARGGKAIPRTAHHRRLIGLFRQVWYHRYQCMRIEMKAPLRGGCAWGRISRRTGQCQAKVNTRGRRRDGKARLYAAPESVRLRTSRRASASKRRDRPENGCKCSRFSGLIRTVMQTWKR